MQLVFLLGQLLVLGFQGVEIGQLLEALLFQGLSRRFIENQGALVLVPELLFVSSLLIFLHQWAQFLTGGDILYQHGHFSKSALCCFQYGGSLGTNGCVSWSFDRKGVIVIDNEDEELDEDTVMMDALDAGAADFQPEEGCFTVYTDPDAINDVAKALEDKGYKFDSAQIEMVPQTYQKLEKQEDRDNMEKMLDLFEEDDDVQNVWHNWDQE